MGISVSVPHTDYSSESRNGKYIWRGRVLDGFHQDCRYHTDDPAWFMAHTVRTTGISR